MCVVPNGGSCQFERKKDATDFPLIIIHAEKVKKQSLLGCLCYFFQHFWFRLMVGKYSAQCHPPSLFYFLSTPDYTTRVSLGAFSRVTLVYSAMYERKFLSKKFPNGRLSVSDFPGESEHRPTQNQHVAHSWERRPQLAFSQQ